MQQTTLFPLRTTTGPLIGVRRDSKGAPDLKIVELSPDARAGAFVFTPRWRASAFETRQDPLYREFLPRVVANGVTVDPAAGAGELPSTTGSPFRSDQPCISLFGRATQDVPNGGKGLAVAFRIALERPALVGGICYRGFPFLPYEITRFGSVSANHGIPRELRLTALGANQTPLPSAAAYLDADVSATRQDPAAHTGFHFLHVDPVVTDALILRLADFPPIIDTIKLGPPGQPTTTDESFGFVLPALYVFEYKEGTRYKPNVAVGMVASRVQRQSVATPAGAPEMSLSSEYETRIETALGPVRCDFTAASAITPGRHFTAVETQPDGSGRPVNYDECFVSDSLRPGESVTLYLAQAEEFERCVAGLRLFLPFVPERSLTADLSALSQQIALLLPDLALDLTPLGGVDPAQLETVLEYMLRLPPSVNFCEKIGIRVYELDPLEGVSPMEVPLAGRHATLLAEKQIDELSEILSALFLEGVRFKRPSTSRYFAVQFTNRDQERGQMVVKSLALIQSAHVTVHPRASRQRDVRTLNYRIVGPDLAGDYATLGANGFNFAIERWVAGERKAVLFRANSLVDLLHAGAAKIFPNSRRRAVDRETSIVEGGPQGNWEVRGSDTRSDGWRESKTGPEVQGKPEWDQILGTPVANLAADRYGFLDRNPVDLTSRSSQEIRTSTEILAPDIAEPAWAAVAILGNALNAAFQAGESVQEFMDGALPGLTSASVLLPIGMSSQRLFLGFENVWRGLVDSTTQSNLLRVAGMRTATASPFGYARTAEEGWELGREILRAVYADGSPRGVAANVADALSTTPLIMAFGIINSLSLSLSVAPWGIGISGSSPLNAILPSYSYVNSYGSQGSITRQATRTGEQVSRQLIGGFDEATTLSRTAGGRSERVVTRTEVEGRDTERVRGGEVVWQGQLADVITGSISLGVRMPATASDAYSPGGDDSIRVRFGSGVGESVTVDVWFDVVEETMNDDY